MSDTFEVSDIYFHLLIETSEKVIARSARLNDVVGQGATKQSPLNKRKTRLLRQKTSRNDTILLFFRGLS